MTAKMVIASANRLMELRQLCRISSKKAEISVPAWPIPIHQTKFVIANAQATGISTPQIPMPLASRYVIAIPNTMNRNEPNPKAHHQKSGVLAGEHDRANLLANRFEGRARRHYCQRVVGIQRPGRVALPFFQRRATQAP